MAALRLFRRAVLDIQQIEACSVEKWGAKVAETIVGDIEQGGGEPATPS